MTASVKLLYAVFVVFSIILAAADVGGVPVRALILAALLGTLACFFPRRVFDYFERHVGLFIFWLCLTAVGIGLSAAQGKDFQTIAESAIEEMLQVYLLLSCIYVLCAVVGPAYVGNVFIATVFASGAVAIFQFFGIEFFWTLRHLTSHLQAEALAVQHWIAIAIRPVGLSYSTMNLAYQVICALSIALLLCKAKLMKPQTFAFAAAFALLVAIATEVRSLIIAIILCVLVYAVIMTHSTRASRQLSIAAVALVGAASIVMLLTTDPDSRVLSVSDGSAMGRLVLSQLGIDLTLDNPFGFGWDFDSREYSWIYWSELLAYKNADAAIEHGLHNYLLNFTVTYGVLGLLLIFLAFVVAARQFLLSLVIFFPYLANCFFHNSGPLFGEIYFWFPYGIFLYCYDRRLLGERSEVAFGQPAYRGPQPVAIS